MRAYACQQAIRRRHGIQMCSRLGESAKATPRSPRPRDGAALCCVMLLCTHINRHSTNTHTHSRKKHVPLQFIIIIIFIVTNRKCERCERGTWTLTRDRTYGQTDRRRRMGTQWTNCTLCSARPARMRTPVPHSKTTHAQQQHGYVLVWYRCRLVDRSGWHRWSYGIGNFNRCARSAAESVTNRLSRPKICV